MVLDEVECRDTGRERFRIVRCGSCDHLYTLPRPTAAALERYYPDAYYRGRQPGTRKADSSRHHGLREGLARMALRQHFGYPGPTPRTSARRLLSWPLACWLRLGRRTLDAIPWAGGGELCDFGCGDGAFLRLCRRRGWSVCGVDFNEKVAHWARERDRLEVVAGTWPGEALAGRTFDVITAWHVIEHLPDPAGWVRAAAGKLNPGGYLLVCCPDAGSWAFRTFGRDWYGLDVPRHLSHFTTWKLVELLAGAGLAVERIRPQARRKTLHASARLRAARTGSLLWRGLAASSLPWRPVARVTGWLGCADGVLVVARKPPPPAVPSPPGLPAPS
jgi:2-polyprenyl-3-methyl-5-hydroxy-6-metoxy-1,4-benzoquinol methylase